MTDARATWTEPGPETVAPGVHRVPLPLPMDGLRAVNIYVLETEDGLTCIDGGWAIEESRSQLEQALKELGHQLGEIRRFLVTHAHRDHYTQAAALRRELGVAVVELGIGEQPTFELFHSDLLDSDPTVPRLRLTGAHDLAERWRSMFEGKDVDLGLWAFPDSWIEGSQDLHVGGRTLRAVPTPGHTAGHVVFADLDSGLLFAGDHVLPHITPSVGFELVYVRDPLGDFLGSLHTVREQLPDLRLLPAHGPVTESSHARVEELLAHHDRRLELCRAAVSATGSTAFDVARQLSWTRHERSFGELDMFNAAMACMETMVHLDRLVLGGRLRRAEKEGTAVYHPAVSPGRP